MGIARGERSFFPENNNHQGKKLNFDFFFLWAWLQSTLCLSSLFPIINNEWIKLLYKVDKNEHRYNDYMEKFQFIFLRCHLLCPHAWKLVYARWLWNIRGETTSDTKSIKQLEGHLSRAKANDFFKRESRRRNSIRKALYIYHINFRRCKIKAKFYHRWKNTIAIANFASNFDALRWRL